MHNCVTSHLWLKSALHASSHPCMCTCVLRLGCFLLISPVFYFVPPFSFQPFLMFTSEFNERFRSNPCATSAWGPWPLLTTRHPSHRTDKPVKCEDNRVMHVHDRTVKPVESSTNTHTVQEFDSPGHRDTTSSNANKFNLAIDEETSTSTFQACRMRW